MSWGRLFRLHAEARLEEHPDRPGQSRWIRGENAVALPTKIAALLAGLDGRTTLGALAGTLVSPEALRPVLDVLVREGVAEDLGPEPLLARVDLRHQCHGCGMSCQGHFIGPLDEAYLARAATVHAAVVAERPELAGVEPIVERQLGQRRIKGLAVMPDGACLYLDSSGCSVHRLLGAEAKPDGCRLFPMELLADPGGARVAVSPGCARAHRGANPQSFSQITGLPMDRLPPPPRRPAEPDEAALLLAIDDAPLGEKSAAALAFWCGHKAQPESLLSLLPLRRLGQELLSEYGAIWSKGRPGGLWARQLRLARSLAFSELPARPLSAERDAWVATTLADRVWVRAFAPLGGLRPGLLWALTSAALSNALAPGDALDDPFGENLALCVRLSASCPAPTRMCSDPGLQQAVLARLAR